MQRWDYRVWICELSGTETKWEAEEYLESILNMNGNDGWELVSVVPIPASDGTKLAYHLKIVVEDE